MAIGRRFIDNVPNLLRPWNDVRRELLEFLRKLRDSSNDGIPPGYSGTTPTTVVIGGTANPGTENAGWMAADAALVMGDPAPPFGLANAASEGTGSAPAREDHQHKRDVRVAKAGSDVGTRNRLNFIDGSGINVTVADDAGNDEVDVTIALSGSGAEEAELLAWLGN